MLDLFDTPALPNRAATQLLQPLLVSGNALSRAQLNAAMAQAFDGSDADGRRTQRDSFEVLEHAVALHMRTTPCPQPNVVLMTRLIHAHWGGGRRSHRHAPPASRHAPSAARRTPVRHYARLVRAFGQDVRDLRGHTLRHDDARLDPPGRLGVTSLASA